MYNLIDMNKQIKLLATDLDGTLFYPKRPRTLIPSKNIKFIDRFINQGHKVVLVTGRSPAYAKNVFARLGHTVDVIGMNGAYTITDGKVMNEHFLDFPISKVLFELNSLFPTLGSMLISRKYPLLISTPTMGRGIMRAFYNLFYWMQGNYAEDYVFSNEAFLEEIKSKEVYKVMLFFGLSKKGQRMARKANAYLRENYDGQLEASWTGSFIEITPVGVSKAQGIKRYIAKKDIPDENVYVVGDSGNDISMFNTFHERSFCLSHAHKKVKKYAKTIISRFHHLERYIVEEKK